jgi:hypothetical protein
MLVAEDPGAPTDYACMINALTWKQKHVADLIVAPYEGKLDGRRICTFVVAGFRFTFFVASHPPPPGIFRLFLQSNGSLIIGVNEVSDDDVLYGALLEMAKLQIERNT